MLRHGSSSTFRFFASPCSSLPGTSTFSPLGTSAPDPVRLTPGLASAAGFFLTTTPARNFFWKSFFLDAAADFLGGGRGAAVAFGSVEVDGEADPGTREGEMRGAGAADWREMTALDWWGGCAYQQRAGEARGGRRTLGSA